MPLSLSVILTKRPRTTRRHAGFTAIWVDGRMLLAGVCNGHTIVEKIIHTVTVNIACGCNQRAEYGPLPTSLVAEDKQT
jgi:hypothetical protein